MKRKELFDKILQHLYNDPNHYHNLIPTCKENFNVKNGRMIESIGDELLARGWATSKNQSKYSLNIHYNGQLIIESYGSYSSFLKEENKTKVEESTKERTDRIINNTSKISAVIFGLISLILGYNKFFVDNQKIEKQQEEIQILNKTIDSLQIKLKTQSSEKTSIESNDSAKVSTNN